jgi:ABC-type Mn2+/Zn2+ transport system ATPase subunit
MNQQVVRAERLKLGYTNRVVLQDLNFTVSQGETVGLLGSSGSGKSTLLAGLSGANVVLEGEITVNSGANTRGRKIVGLVPQLGEEQWGPLCVAEVVALGMPTRGLKTPKSHQVKIDSLLEELGLSDVRRRRMNEISGGQRQRVSIARALSVSSSVVLCDEPTSGADPSLAAEIIDILSEVADKGVVVIIATHDISVVVPRLKRVIGLSGGRVVVDKPVSELTRDDIASVYGEEVIRL